MPKDQQVLHSAKPVISTTGQPYYLDTAVPEPGPMKVTGLYIHIPAPYMPQKVQLTCKDSTHCEIEWENGQQR